MKVKFDPKKLQEFLLSHGEKILFGLVVLGFVWFAQYTFFHREGISKTPSELARLVEDTWKRIQRPPEKLPVQAKDYEEIIKKTIGRIDPKDYSHQVLWCPPIFDPLPKRGEPRLLTVRDLRAAPGCAKVYVTPASPTGPTLSPEEMGLTEGSPATGPVSGLGRETTGGERWVVLTGLVPYKEQIEAYREAFRAAMRENLITAGLQAAGAEAFPGVVPNPAARLMEGAMPGAIGPAGAPTGASSDMPVYVHYHVQRVEVSSESDSIDETAWEAGTINIRKAKQEATSRWGSSSGTGTDTREIGISPIFWEQALDFPLPRFADGRSLDDTFAHAPEIPLLKKRTWQIGPDGRPVPIPPSSSSETTESTPPATGEKLPGSKTLPKDLPDLPGGVPGIGPPGMGPPPPGTIPGAWQPGMEGYGPMGPMPGTAPGSFYGTIRLPDHKLFRFIDRTVEPGKRYRYRVRLLLANPNYNQPARLLERPELGKDPWIITPWSEPSNVVEVPRDDRLLLLAVKPSASYQAETSAKVALLKWLHTEGEMAVKEEERVFRGQILNLPNQKWPEEDIRKTPSTPKPSKPSGKSPPGVVPGMEDVQVLMEVGAPKKKSPKEKEKEKTPLIPEWMGPMGPQPKEPLDIDYLTECLVIDLRGGYRIDLRGQGRPPHADPSYNAPGEMLLLHPEGYLYVQNELDDAIQYEKILQLRAPKYDDRFGPGWMGMPPGILEGMPPPAGVPGELAPGETGRPKSKSKPPTRGEERTPTPKPSYPPRG
ncbi:MAG: hypothetical protein NZ602_09215 [Thermoguttaceae bacterium]|nr:hypothetical protein [Thermoguttaceae bacterium]MDW8039710.1 hypothetical protein [Thermoguttaceae bacterium]